MWHSSFNQVNVSTNASENISWMIKTTSAGSFLPINKVPSKGIMKKSLKHTKVDSFQVLQHNCCHKDTGRTNHSCLKITEDFVSQRLDNLLLFFRQKMEQVSDKKRNMSFHQYVILNFLLNLNSITSGSVRGYIILCCSLNCSKE